MEAARRREEEECTLDLDVELDLDDDELDLDDDPFADPDPFRGSSRCSDEPRASVLIILIDCVELESNAVRPINAPDKYPDKCIES